MALRIATVGLGTWEQDSLRATVGLASGTEIGQWLYEADAAHSSVVLAGDANREGRAWLERAAAPDDGHAPLVVACIERGETSGQSGTLVLRKPIAYTELVALLRGLEPVLRDRAQAQRVPTLRAAQLPVPLPAPLPAPQPVQVPAQPAAPPTTSPAAPAEAALPGRARRSGRFFDGTRLLGLVRCVLSSGVVTELSHPKFPLLTVYPASRTYTFEVDPALMPEMFRSSSLEFDARRQAYAAWSAAHPLVHHPVTRLLFYAARYGAEGRLAEGTEVDDVYELAASADLAVVDVDARDRRVLSHLGKGPATLHAIVAATGIDFDSVVDFMGACTAVGFVYRRSRAGIERAVPPTGVADDPVGSGLTATVAQFRERVKSALPRHGA